MTPAELASARCLRRYAITMAARDAHEYATALGFPSGAWNGMSTGAAILRLSEDVHLLHTPRQPRTNLAGGAICRHGVPHTAPLNFLPDLLRLMDRAADCTMHGAIVRPLQTLQEQS